MISSAAKEKDDISGGPGNPPRSYPLELPDRRVLAFDLKRMGRDSEETKKQQCQVEASSITVEFTQTAVHSSIPSLDFMYCSDVN